MFVCRKELGSEGQAVIFNKKLAKAIGLPKGPASPPKIKRNADSKSLTEPSSSKFGESSNIKPAVRAGLYKR